MNTPTTLMIGKIWKMSLFIGNILYNMKLLYPKIYILSIPTDYFVIPILFDRIGVNGGSIISVNNITHIPTAMTKSDSMML